MRIPILVAGALILTALVAAAPARADPVAVNPTGNAKGDVVAVSGTGNAACSQATCVAVSGTGKATAGCTTTTAFECSSITKCATFACLALAASGTGDAKAFAWCTTFGYVCLGVSMDAFTGPSVYYCITDVNNDVKCNGAA